MARRRVADRVRRRAPYRRRLVMMAKVPRLGAVKSRLARDIGWGRATAFHRHAVHALARRLAPSGRWECLLAVTPDRRRFDACPMAFGVPRLAQGPGDVGARMHRIMANLPPGPAIIVGTDIPQMRPAHLAEAFALLGNHRAVFGPAMDGGYWLVGLRRSPRMPAIFGNVRWSSPEALADTAANVEANDVGFARRLSDVDNEESYRRLASAGGRVVLPPWWRPRD